MQKLSIVLICAALGGCVTQPGQGELFASQDQIAAKDDAICRGYGAQPGTPAYVNCRGQQDMRRDAFKR